MNLTTKKKKKKKKNLFQQPLDLYFVKPLLDYAFHVNPI